MIYLILIILFLALTLGPQYWARHILEKYSENRSDIPGSGGQLVTHLKQKFALDSVSLEATQSPDHYDPTEKVIRLSQNNFNDHSLTAIAVAAHEFGHALQDASNYRPLAARTKLVGLAKKSEKLSRLALLALPLLSFSPLGARAVPIMVAILILSISLNTIVHFITLPVEFDASFGRALPILKQGQYVDQADLDAVRKILRACALTYLASSLAGLLNFWRWLRFLKR